MRVQDILGSMNVLVYMRMPVVCITHRSDAHVCVYVSVCVRACVRV